jgi:hypothetical protein
VLPAILATWRLTYFADGLALVPPGGRVHGGIRIRDRIRPLASAADVVEATMRELNLPDLQVTPLERLVTSEGEDAVIARITGTTNGAAFERTVAVLFGDDFYTQIDGVTAVPARLEPMRQIMRDLAQTYSLGLGELRRRRYFYAPPSGWTGYPRGLITEWQPPGFPNDPSSIAVFPARPIAETVAGALDRALHELGWGGFAAMSDSVDQLSTARFATGLVRKLTGTQRGQTVHQHIAVLGDSRFLYVCRLESTAQALDGHRGVFAELLDSIEPVPSPRRDVAPNLDVMASWVD